MQRLLGSTTLVLVLLFGPSVRGEFPPAKELPLRPELPDPLDFFDGTKVDSLEVWESRRAPELRALFQHYMYGVLADPPENMTFDVRREEPRYFNGKATLREVVVSLGAVGSPKLHLLVVLPNRREQAAPVFVGLNSGGNHMLLNDPQITLTPAWIPERIAGPTNRASDAGRGLHKEAWPLEQAIDRGYAVITCYAGDIRPDRPELEDGVQPYFRGGAGDSRGGTIAAWAWGLMRMVDYAVGHDEFDPRRIIVFGHSRRGKTALLAGAFDPRIRLIIPHQAGCGGTSPSRTTVGEVIQLLNRVNPHWMCDNFKKFSYEPARLPFDQHCLIALCAPRPVLLSNAVEDVSANPAGQFAMLVAASPVYRLYGDVGTTSGDKPPVGKLLAHTLGYFIREGKHSTTPEDWRAFLDFADAHFSDARTK